jgi:hypothetical protein
MEKKDKQIVAIIGIVEKDILLIGRELNKRLKWTLINLNNYFWDRLGYPENLPRLQSLEEHKEKCIDLPFREEETAIDWATVTLDILTIQTNIIIVTPYILMEKMPFKIDKIFNLTAMDPRELRNWALLSRSRFPNIYNKSQLTEKELKIIREDYEFVDKIILPFHAYHLPSTSFPIVLYGYWRINIRRIIREILNVIRLKI